ncbi:MAG: fibronectin type III domain-containing protein, partial [Planctomycetota bacterium]
MSRYSSLFVAFCAGLMFLQAGCDSDSRVQVNPFPEPDDRTAPSDVSGFTATAGLDSVTLSWQAATDDEGISGYKIKLTDPVLALGSEIPSTLVVPLGTLSVEWPGLAGGTAYTFTIVAIDSSNNVSLNVSTVTASPVVPDEERPADVTDLSGAGGLSDPANPASEVEMTLTWTPSESTDVSHYLVCIGTSSGVCDVLNNFNVGNISILTLPDNISGPVFSGDLLTPLQIDTEYTIRVITVDTSGNQSTPGATATVTPTLSTDATPPDAVRNLEGDPGNTQVVLSWDEPFPIGDANRFS